MPMPPRAISRIRRKSGSSRSPALGNGWEETSTFSRAASSRNSAAHSGKAPTYCPTTACRSVVFSRSWKKSPKTRSLELGADSKSPMVRPLVAKKFPPGFPEPQSGARVTLPRCSFGKVDNSCHLFGAELSVEAHAQDFPVLQLQKPERLPDLAAQAFLALLARQRIAWTGERADETEH